MLTRCDQCEAAAASPTCCRAEAATRDVVPRPPEVVSLRRAGVWRWSPRASGPRAGWRVQIVDRLDAVQLAFEAIQRAAQLRDRAVVRQVAVQLGEDLPATLHDRLVLDAARLVKERPDLLLRHGLDPVDVDQSGLAAERLNFLHEPLEELRRLRGLRQDPGRAAEPDGAHALELAPYPDAVAGRRRRKTHQEHQPAHRSASVTLDTRRVKRYTTLDRPRRITDGTGADATARAHPRACPVLSAPRPARLRRPCRARRPDGTRDGRRAEVADQGGDA